MRIRRQAIAASVTTAALAGALFSATYGTGQSLDATAVASTTTADAPAKQVALGVYRGGAAAGVAGHKAFDAWTGVRSPIAVDFSAGQTWDDITGRGWALNPWGETDYRLVYSVAMFPTSLASGPGPAAKAALKDCADGKFAGYWARLGRNLVKTGLEDTIVRPGWEMNGDWFPWSSGGQEETWAQCYRSIVTAMRSIEGQNFAFDWNVSAGVSHSLAEPAYPGDDYVDYVGLDLYDWSWTTGVYNDKATQTPAQRDAAVKRSWTDAQSGDHGLRYWAAWAASHNKQISFPEWGVSERPGDSYGGGDNPYFIDQMMKFIYNPANNVGYASYFDFDAPDGDHKLFDPTEFPASADAYKRGVNAPPIPVIETPTPAPSDPGVPAKPLPPCPPTPPAPAITPYTLWTSADGQYTNIKPLEGSTIGWAIFAWMEPAGPLVKRVGFYLDNPAATGASIHDEYSPKYDFQGSGDKGGSRPFDAFDLKPGTHTLTAKVELKDGSTVLSTSTFTKPGGATPAPTCTPVETPPSAPTAVPAVDGSALRVSWYSNRRSDKSLHWSGVSKQVYLFLSPGVDATSVSYYLDDPARSKAATSITTKAPFDFVQSDGKRAVNAAKLTAGQHSLTALITFADGTVKQSTATFHR